MLVQIPHVSEGMVGRWTPSYPAIVRTFAVRIIGTVGLMLHPGLLDLITFITEGTDVTPSGLAGCINTMLGLLVLMHSLIAREFLNTVRASNPYTLHTSLCVLCPGPLSGKHLPTLTTWEFLTPVYTHVYHQMVVGLEEGPLAHRTVLSFPGNRRNLVGDLSDLPGLGIPWQVLPSKKS